MRVHMSASTRGIMARNHLPKVIATDSEGMGTVILCLREGRISVQRLAYDYEFISKSRSRGST